MGFMNIERCNHERKSDYNALCKLMSKLIDAGLRGSSQVVVNGHIYDYLNAQKRFEKKCPKCGSWFKSRNGQKCRCYSCNKELKEGCE